MATKTKDKMELTEAVVLSPMQLQNIELVIVGLTPLITHAWDTKAKQMMLDKQQKKAVKKEARDPEQEFLSGLYTLEDGGYGVPVDALKQCIVSVGNKDVDKNLAKTRLRRAFFINQDGFSTNGSVPCCKIIGEPRKREDMVRIGMGTADLRFRPEFPDWSIKLNITLDREMLSAEQLTNLINRAGFGVGIGEWRPEKDGQFGRFQVLT